MTLADGPFKNTDRELWREPAEVGMEYYANSIHVNEGGGVGINVGGLVFVKTLETWHALAAAELARTDPETLKRMGALRYKPLLDAPSDAARISELEAQVKTLLGAIKSMRDCNATGPCATCDAIAARALATGETP